MYQSMWPEVLPRPGNRRLEKMQSLSPWFEIYRVSDGVFAVLEPGHAEEAISYLILGGERAVVLDTGMGIADLHAEVKRLTDLPLVVVVSHGHYDHVGDNHRFSEVWAFDCDSDVARIETGKSRQECTRYNTCNQAQPVLIRIQGCNESSVTARQHHPFKPYIQNSGPL